LVINIFRKFVTAIAIIIMGWGQFDQIRP
jgi:hypothetical protein